jgi:hypothetical protein
LKKKALQAEGSTSRRLYKHIGRARQAGLLP